jgi:hypothetical protein
LFKIILKNGASSGHAGFLASSVADPCHFSVDPDADPDPLVFIIDLQDANKKLIKKKSFSAYYLLKVL